MQAQRERSGSGLLWLALLVLAALVILAMHRTVQYGAVLPQQLPSLQDVRPRAHAVERHGQDAIEARGCLQHCSPDRLRVKLCPPSARHGLSVVYWCEVEGPTCPGTVLTIGGVERSSYFKPCVQWATCR